MNTTQHNTTQHNTTQHNTTQHLKTKILCLVLFAVTSFLMAQGNKKVVTRYGEIVTYDIRITTAERDALPDKTVGMQIFNTTTKCHEFWDGSAWYNYCWKGTTPPPPIIPSTGGTATVSAYNCSDTAIGTMNVGTAVSGVTQTIIATVTTVGTYNITATSNGVTFTGAGTFAGTGAQTIVLTATGVPAAVGTHTFVLSTTPGCSFDRITGASTKDNTVINTIVGAAGKIWMDRNLGASQVATSLTDYKAYGSLYQFGRGADGHQLINWTSSTTGTPVYGTTNVLSLTDSPLDALFIIGTSASGYDWRNVRNDNLWQGINGPNNPCPAGFRIPTLQEWNSEFTAAGITDGNSAFTKMKLTIPGWRNSDGTLYAIGAAGDYWTVSHDAGVAGNPQLVKRINPSSVSQDGLSHSLGTSVRCIKD